MNFSFRSVGFVGALAAPVGGFSFTDLSGLYAWHEADGQSMADNDPVGDTGSELQDLSGNGHLGLQSSAGARPLYKTGIIDGKPVIRFDGTDDYLQYGSDIALGTGDYTIIFVGTITAATDAMVMGWSSGNIQIRCNRSGAQTISKFLGVSDQSSQVFTNPSNVVGMKVWQRSGIAMKFYENLTDQSLGANDGSSFSLSTIGKTSFGGFMPGDLLALGICTAAVSAMDLASLYTDYLKPKYPSLP